jgi:hypothetical protein
MVKSSKTPTSGGEAGTKRVKSSKTAPHIGRRSRNEEGQIFEDSSSHRAAKPERIEPNLSKDRQAAKAANAYAHFLDQ